VLSRSARARLRLAIAAAALVPLALLARMIGSERLNEAVQRRWARQWKEYDTRGRDGGTD
jgi:hypothetical protein